MSNFPRNKGKLLTNIFNSALKERSKEVKNMKENTSLLLHCC